MSDNYPFDRLKGNVALGVHGDQDTSNPIEASQRMAAAAKRPEVETVPPPFRADASRGVLTYASQILISWDSTAANRCWRRAWGAAARATTLAARRASPDNRGRSRAPSAWNGLVTAAFGSAR